jgi:hypothetical protein
LGRAISDFRSDVVHINYELWPVDSMLARWRRTSAVVVYGAENQFRQDTVTGRMRVALARAAIKQLHGYASWNEAGPHFVAQRAQAGLPTLTSQRSFHQPSSCRAPGRLSTEPTR